MSDSCEVIAVGIADAVPAAWDASVLLAGPDEAAWQAEAVAELRRRWTHPGLLVVFTAGWDAERADKADIVLFWPAETGDPAQSALVSVVWGGCEGSGRVVLGLPDEGPLAALLHERALRRRIPIARGLTAATDLALAAIGPGAYRDGAHRDVPLALWRTDSFRYWLAAKERAGHRVDQARVAWSLAPRPLGGVFLWAVHPSIHIGDEDRVKSNEIVIGRTDVASVVAYHRGPSPADCEIVLVREFRSPAVTADGRVHELPGGSQVAAAPLTEVAAEEFGEETGLVIDAARLRGHGARQPVGTLCAHRQHLFSVELTAGEMAGLRTDPGPHGLVADGELTMVEIVTMAQILSESLVDWTTLGLIATVLAEIDTA